MLFAWIESSFILLFEKRILTTIKSYDYMIGHDMTTVDVDDDER